MTGTSNIAAKPCSVGGMVGGITIGPEGYPLISCLARRAAASQSRWSLNGCGLQSTHTHTHTHTPTPIPTL